MPALRLLALAVASIASVGWTFGRNDLPPKAPAEAPAPAQPLPFSHREHARLGLDCLLCHEMPEPGWEMTLPADEKCMQCHQTMKAKTPAIVKLADYYKTHRHVPWARVYRVPDYVFFSHKRHFKKAGIACQECHGPVAERDALAQEKPTNMAACVDCHAQKKAPVTCRFCHDR